MPGSVENWLLGVALVAVIVGIMIRVGGIRLRSMTSQDILRRARDDGDPLAGAYAVQSLGNKSKRKGHWAAAERHYRNALALFRETGEHLDEAHASTKLAEVLRFQHDLPGARRHHQEALELYRDLGAGLDEANALMSLGDISRSEKDLADAERHYRDAQERYREVGLGEGGVRVVVALAPFSDNPAEEFTRAIEACQAVDDLLSLASIRYKFGRWAAEAGEFDVAREQFLEVRDLYLSLDKHEDLVEVEKALQALPAADGDGTGRPRD